MCNFLRTLNLSAMYMLDLADIWHIGWFGILDYCFNFGTHDSYHKDCCVSSIRLYRAERPDTAW